MAKIAISIVMFRNKVEMLERTIRSAMANANGQDQYKLYLVDNSPTDELKKLKDIDPRINYDFVNANVGFGTAHNRALRLTENWADAHLFLNPDVEFGPEVIPVLMRYLEAHSDVGLCMPKIVNFDGSLQPACKLLPSPQQLILRRLPFVNGFASKNNWLYEMHAADFSREMNVPFLSGCFMFTRMSILKQVGGFDERFFMYQEDTDLCRRIHQVSKTMYVPEVVVRHEGQYASRRNRKLLIAHILSAVRYYNKWGWIFDRSGREINRRAIAAYHLDARP